jgi:hypothetical protein
MQNDETPQETLVRPDGSKGWQPPPVFIPELDKFIEHNRKHPERHIGSIKIAAWLKRNGLVVSKDAVYRWLKHRSNGSK